MQRRINEELMKKGITIIDPDSTFISYGTKIGSDTTIYPFTVIERNVKIGRCCSVGPFIHLREGTQIEDDVAVGNFLEVVRSRISKKTLAKHFGYIGDTRIGRMVNIGAGTVTANFDGRKKNITVIKDKAFIGSDTVLVAPVKIGKQAVTGAGSVIVKNNNVANGETVVGVPAKPLKTKKKK
jgi:bifunctional UDP-N-acetylglucosamine pyrophosphorylase/glucosamine-1-phosphate N-acetyltransferase